MFVKKCLYTFLEKANQTAVPYSKCISKTKKVEHITLVLRPLHCVPACHWTQSNYWFMKHRMVNGQNTFPGGCSLTCYEGHSGHLTGTVCLLSPWWRSNIQFVCAHIAGKKTPSSAFSESRFTDCVCRSILFNFHTVLFLHLFFHFTALFHCSFFLQGLI